MALDRRRRKVSTLGWADKREAGADQNRAMHIFERSSRRVTSSCACEASLEETRKRKRKNTAFFDDTPKLCAVSYFLIRRPSERLFQCLYRRRAA